MPACAATSAHITSAIAALMSKASPIIIAPPSVVSCNRCVHDSATPEVCGRSVRRWQMKSHNPANNQIRYQQYASHDSVCIEIHQETATGMAKATPGRRLENMNPGDPNEN